MLGLKWFGKNSGNAAVEDVSSGIATSLGNSSTVEMLAAQTLPTQPTPKAPTKPQAFPSYVQTAGKSTAPLPVTDKRLTNTDFTTYRSGANTATIMRNFAAASPDLAAAISAYLRTGIPNEYTAVAKNLDGSFNPEATSLVQQIITRMDVLPTYADGFSGSYSLRSVAESLGKELLLYGACSAELVLDKTRTPSRIQPLHVGHITFIPDGSDLIPIQTLAGQRINLDIPTFFWVSLDQDLLTPYASSPLEPALRPTLFSEDFMQDLWRVVKRAVHPRQTVTIDWEKLQKMMPPEAQHDSEAQTVWMNNVIKDVTDTVNGLTPDQALVKFDFIDVERESNGNSSLSNEWSTLQDIANSKLASGAKTLPAILGHATGSNTASTESMLFVKSADGTIRSKLNEIFSRILTLAVRLYGNDVTVEFKYAGIDLRPDTELESFKVQKQSRILELLSYGFLTDEEASLELTGKLPPQGFTPLSGTQFTVTKAQPGSGYNGATNDGSTLNKNLKSDAPAGGGRGSNTKNQGVKQ